MKLKALHHIAIICSDYEKSKYFYTHIMGFTIINETYRKHRHSYKLDLALNDIYTIELFSFESPPKRLTMPEATGLRHIAFAVEHIENAISFLKTNGINAEPIRVDEITGKRFTFFNDPDNLPIELYESI